VRPECSYDPGLAGRWVGLFGIGHAAVTVTVPAVVGTRWSCSLGASGSTVYRRILLASVTLDRRLGGGQVCVGISGLCRHLVACVQRLVCWRRAPPVCLVWSTYLPTSLPPYLLGIGRRASGVCPTTRRPPIILGAAITRHKPPKLPAGRLLGSTNNPHPLLHQTDPKEPFQRPAATTCARE